MTASPSTETTKSQLRQRAPLGCTERDLRRCKINEGQSGVGTFAVRRRRSDRTRELLVIPSHVALLLIRSIRCDIDSDASNIVVREHLRFDRIEHFGVLDEELFCILAPLTDPLAGEREP